MRLLPYEVLDGAANMAADETLLESALAGIASLRFYGWSEPTVSLGYFQPARVRQDDRLLRELPMVRRPTGGETLVHHHELTYALALPAGRPWHGGQPWAERMHAIIRAALSRLGVSTEAVRQDQPGLSSLCFQHPTAGDLWINQVKVVGSAQRRRRGALLQHGAILLAASPHAPQLPGIRELTGRNLEGEEVSQAIRAAAVQETGWETASGAWTEDELRRRTELEAARYRQAAWNARR